MLPVVSRTKLIFAYDVLGFDSVWDWIENDYDDAAVELLDELFPIYVLSIGDDSQFDYNDEVLTFVLLDDGRLAIGTRHAVGEPCLSIHTTELESYLSHGKLPPGVVAFVHEMVEGGQAEIKSGVDFDLDLS